MIVGEIRQEARIMLTGHWSNLVPIWFIYLLIAAGSSAILPTFGSLLTLVVGGPLTMGLVKIFFRIYNKEKFELGQLFDGFKEFSRTLTAYLLIALYVLLWALLLIVPGIIAALGYSMTFFIMAENPQLPATEAMQQSKRIMMGHKWDFFRLELSFIGWAILAAIPFGIGFLWLESYIYAAMLLFYKKIKGQESSTTAEGETIVSGPEANI